MKSSSHHIASWVFVRVSSARAPLPPFKQTPPGWERLCTWFGIFLHGRPGSSLFIELLIHGLIVVVAHRHLVYVCVRFQDS